MLIEEKDALNYNNINNKQETDEMIRDVIYEQEITSFPIDKRKQYIKIVEEKFKYYNTFIEKPSESVYYTGKNKSKECKATCQFSRIFCDNKLMN